jgi:hypothetical protein
MEVWVPIHKQANLPRIYDTIRKKVKGDLFLFSFFFLVQMTSVLNHPTTLPPSILTYLFFLILIIFCVLVGLNKLFTLLTNLAKTFLTASKILPFCAVLKIVLNHSCFYPVKKIIFLVTFLSIPHKIPLMVICILCVECLRSQHFIAKGLILV